MARASAVGQALACHKFTGNRTHDVGARAFTEPDFEPEGE